MSFLLTKFYFIFLFILTRFIYLIWLILIKIYLFYNIH